MRKLLFTSLMLSAMAVALSGCGGGGWGRSGGEVSTAATLPTAAYLPLKVGNWWHYKIGTTTGLETFKLTGTATAGTATFYVATSSRPGGATCTLKSGWYRHSTTGLRYRATKTSSEVLILKPPLTAGATWSSGGRSFKITRTDATLSVPASVFGPCLVVQETVGTKKTLFAYAAGLGIVQVTQGTATLVSLFSTSLQGTTSLMPLKVGNQWTYSYTEYASPAAGARARGWSARRGEGQSITKAMTATDVVTVTGTQMIGSAIWCSVISRYAGEVAPPPVYIRHDIYGLARRDSLNGASFYLIRNPIEVGTHWTTSWVSGDGSNQSSLEIVAVGQTVTVPAGTYSKCVKITDVLTTPGQPNDVITYWYAPNVGEVKEEQRIGGSLRYSIKLLELRR